MAEPGYHNGVYNRHRDGCQKCKDVDNHMGGQRCDWGKKLVKKAQQELDE